MPPTVGAWEKVSDADRLTKGDTYRMLGAVNGPYNTVSTLAVGTLILARFTAKGYRVISFDHAAPVMNAHNYQLGPWPFIVKFVPETSISQAGLDPRAIIAIVALIIVGALALKLVRSDLEHLITTIGDVAGNTAKKVLNPITVVAVVLLLVIFTGAIKVR